ncbi:MAG TPA: UDP-N-acetylmuramoyl-L-alanyl-D-glutamate--2,6-diaminopimelate ligase [Micromonosporaceae bacterium]|nr:UDP-N-acetylmuramoyl-L-alanyl-D-glutamate--2,6-diaminopimelate ligase [Micromonosporaceae bacterium]
MADIARVTGGQLAGAGATGQAGPAGAVTVTGVTLASSEVRPGDLFAALPGARAHGARFVPAAAGAGATAVLTDAEGAPAALAAGLPAIVCGDPRAVLGTAAAEVYGHPADRLLLIGLTGTAGKTTTAYLVESGLRRAGHVTGLIGTVETRLGDLVVDSVRTTPEASDLHALFAVAVEHGVTAMVMEVSSHALALDRVGGVRFAVGGYTNFGTDHLDFHKDVADYFAAKAKLFDGRSAVEILNADDPALGPLRGPGTVTYSAAGEPSATWRATGIRDDGFAQRFTATGPGGAIDAAVGMPGRHNVANALLAIASLVAVGVDAATAAAGVAECPGVPGRLEKVPAPGPVTGVVDYAHKPDAIVAALDALRSRGGRLICVLGAGGDRDRGKRPVMGAAAARGSDLLIVTDDNPRGEDPAVIRAEVLRGAVESGAAAEVIEVDGRRAAIAEAVRRAAPGDTVAVLGKGHERGQEISGELHPFDDRVELAAALAERFGDGAATVAGGTHRAGSAG